MRRFAKNSRNDKVRSTRDYQQISERPAVVIHLNPDQPARMVFATDLREDAGDFVGVGGFIRSDAEMQLQLDVQGREGDRILVHALQSTTQWTRFGVVIPRSGRGNLRVQMTSCGRARKVYLWGLDAGVIFLPELATVRGKLTAEILTAPHLAPETFFLSHDTPIGMDIIMEDWENATVTSVRSPILVKKCAYCQRFLPIDPARPNALSFHKHNDKVSGHQNECRACKKWRINNAFNPDRTADQLHESSVITRERKLFLRDPEILQQIKDRSGDGLKTMIWERFGKECFRCGRPLRIEEVELDHTRPMAYLWPIDEHATCLCSTCNNYKKDRFPTDVYSDTQLRRLAGITGLAYDTLIKKEVNQLELGRICSDIASFAAEWHARTFNATARKVRELHPQIDLFKLLEIANPEVHARVRAELARRPDAVEG